MVISTKENFSVKKKLTIKKRNLVAKDMFTSGLYRPKVEFGIKIYKRNSKHKGSYYEECELY